VAEQMLQESDDVRVLIRVLLHVHQQPAARGDAADDREVIACRS
jgi:hypothetical protein